MSSFGNCGQRLDSYVSFIQTLCPKTIGDMAVFKVVIKLIVLGLVQEVPSESKHIKSERLKHYFVFLRHLELPFAPYPGLVLVGDGSPMSKIEVVEFDVNNQEFTCQVTLPWSVFFSGWGGEKSFDDAAKNRFEVVVSSVEKIVGFKLCETGTPKHTLEILRGAEVKSLDWDGLYSRPADNPCYPHDEIRLYQVLEY